jgi:phosphatidylserine synthase
VLVLLLAALMVSNVKYPRWPRIGLKSASAILGLVLHVAILAGAVLAPSAFLFPLGVAYMLYGIVRSTTLSLLDRGAPTGEGLPPPPADPEVRHLDLGRRRREGRGDGR